MFLRYWSDKAFKVNFNLTFDLFIEKIKVGQLVFMTKQPSKFENT